MSGAAGGAPVAACGSEGRLRAEPLVCEIDFSGAQLYLAPVQRAHQTPLPPVPGRDPP